MSLQTDMQTLIEENARLGVQLERAQLELQQEKSASRIKELDQRLSAGKPGNQALQPAIPTGSADPVLRAEIAQLQKQIAEKDSMITAKDATIVQQGDEIFALHEAFSKVPDGLIAMGQELRLRLSAGAAGLREFAAQGAAEEHEPQRQLTPTVSVTDTDKPVKTFSTSTPKGAQGDNQTRSQTPSPGLTPAKFPAESTSKSTTPPLAPYAQALTEGRKTPAPRRANIDQAFMPNTTHAEFAAKKQAERKAPSGAQKQQTSRKPKRAYGHGTLMGPAASMGRGNSITHGHWRGRGSKGLYSTQVIVPANHEKRAGPEVTNATESMNQPSEKPHVDVPVATSQLQIGQGNLVDKGKEISNHLRGEAAPFVPNSMPIAVSDKPPGWTDAKYNNYKFLGFRIPSAEDTMKADLKTPMSEETSSNARKRSADEEQPDASASLKRLHI